MLIHELSRSQSSLLVQAIEIDVSGGNDGRRGTGGSVGRGGGRPVMGSNGDSLAIPDTIVSVLTSTVSDKGGAAVIISPIAKAEHLRVGLPVVPGGQMHNGR